MNSNKSKKRITNLGILSFIFLLSTLLNVFSAYAVTETIQYTYDDAQQVIKVVYGNGTEIDYLYDGAGNRITQTITFAGSPANNPPTPPSNLTPPNSSTNTNLTVTLSWTASSDPDTGDVVF